MTTLTLVPRGLHADREQPRTAVLAEAWNRLLQTSGWNALSLAHRRAELLRRAEARDAHEASYAADLRGAALAGLASERW